MVLLIYADNAATTKLDSDAFEAMKPFLFESYGNVSQPYSFARTAKKALKEARENIAKCIGASPDEIFFTSGGTESDNWAIKGLLKCGDNRLILTSNIEHHAILNACAAVERMNYPVKYLPVDKFGILQPNTLANSINSNVKLVTVMLVNNELGTIEPIKELAKIAHENGSYFHTDAVQALGHIEIDVNDLGVDMLSASAHKFNGPKGVGFLYVRRGIDIQPFMDGGTQEFGVRAGTENIASIVAMAKALQKNCNQIKDTKKRLFEMERRFFEILDKTEIDYIRNGSPNHAPGIINISIKNTSGEMILHRLDLKGIYISTGSACDSTNIKVSHVIKAISVPMDYANGTIRISLGKDNRETDVQEIADALIDILKNN
ncbi:cysteine desulfurase family protein [Traorella massiliensis]|uniref:cysteine desulfurase family protein n=1 Tax=Traorella massiliensis TaxID=1903263 RepID=UPI002353F19E|nr:cysteine desulfurase family protein [Traorella massiliensis]